MLPSCGSALFGLDVDCSLFRSRTCEEVHLDVPAMAALALFTAVTFCVCEAGTLDFLTERISSEANPGILIFQLRSMIIQKRWTVRV